jgi:ATP-dependent Clp protease ATP-binding subunit ClpC
MRESRDLNHTHVGSEHLVMGVMRERGPAARVLAQAGANLDVLRNVTLT